MPSGKVHDQLTLASAALTLPLWIVAVPNHDPALYLTGTAAYLFSGFLLSDDLDTNSLCYKRWGVLKFLWWPYRTFVPHRSWLSHGLVIGPLFRVAYFVAALSTTVKCFVLISNKYILVVDRTGILRHTKLSMTEWIFHNPAFVIVIVIGLIFGGFTHSVADYWVSFWKKVW
jgi:uncharacterized metal-binding protein